MAAPGDTKSVLTRALTVPCTTGPASVPGSVAGVATEGGGGGGVSRSRFMRGARAVPSSCASSQVTASVRQASRVASSRLSQTAAPATSKRSSRARQPSLWPPRGVLGAGRSSSRPPDGEAEARGANRFWAGALVSSFMQDLRAAGRHAQKTRCRCTAGWGHASIPAHGCEGILRASPRRSPRGAAALPVPEPPDDAVPALLRPALRHGHSPQDPCQLPVFARERPPGPAGRKAFPAAPAAEKKHFPLLTPPPAPC